jgi:hypothetical protein
MKSNPCFQCVCNPVCRLKVWSRAIQECDNLFDSLYLYYGSFIEIDILIDLESKNFFDKKFLGPA